MTKKQRESENFDLKTRLKKDENSWLKIQIQANRHHAETLNQLADVGTHFERMRLRISHLEKRIDTLEREKEGRIHER